ncbi:MAG: LTA synthase family protein [Alistipes sp.]|nr:LTA synthase family protein [Alistipes sp.]
MKGSLANFLDRAARTRFALLLWRIAMVYAVMFMCRVAFYCYNRDLIGSISAGEIWELLKGTILIDNSSIVYANALFILLSVLPLPLRWWASRWYQRVLFWIYIICNGVLVVAANLGDTVYFHYTQKRCTADEIFFADNGNTAQLMFKFAVDNWHLVVYGVLLIAALSYAYRRHREVIDMTRGKMLYATHTAVLLFTAWLSVSGIRGGITGMTRPITLSNAMLYADTPAKAYFILSNPFCVIRSVDTHIDYERYFDKDRLDAIYTPSHYPEDYTSEMFGRYKGYNVMLVILESFSAEHSKYLSPDLYAEQEQGYTPFLDSLMQRSLTFTRCYANGSVSVAAPPSIWSSMPSYGKPHMLTPYSLGECRPMPRLLRSGGGYQTAFFCGSERGSMGFGAYAHIAGIDNLFSMEDYVDAHGDEEFDGSWGIWDGPFLQFMGEEMGQMQEPFFASIFTLTSHHPFNVPDKYRDLLPDGTTRNHKPVAYTDMSIRRFFERFSGEEWFGRTIFVFVADHVSSEKFSERTLHMPEANRVVGFIHVPDGTLQMRYDSVVSQIDLAPTLLGLLGNDRPYFAIGRDIFNEPWRKPLVLIWSMFNYEIIIDDYIIEFDSHDVKGIYRFDDYLRLDNLRDSAAEEVEWAVNQAKATIQQYFEHVERMSYMPDDRVLSDKPLHAGADAPTTQP